MRLLRLIYLQKFLTLQISMISLIIFGLEKVWKALEGGLDPKLMDGYFNGAFAELNQKHWQRIGNVLFVYSNSGTPEYIVSRRKWSIYLGRSHCCDTVFRNFNSWNKNCDLKFETNQWNHKNSLSSDHWAQSIRLQNYTKSIKSCEYVTMTTYFGCSDICSKWIDRTYTSYAHSVYHNHCVSQFRLYWSPEEINSCVLRYCRTRCRCIEGGAGQHRVYSH